MSMSFFNFSYITNATSWNISFDYSNYNWDQSLKISWWIDAKIDQILIKKFEDSDYYNQFRFLKDLSSKVITVSKKSPSKKDLFSELVNYLSLKSDLLYKVSKIESSSDVASIKNTFKNSIKTKWVTLNTVMYKVNSTGKVEITNDNDNFSKLSEKDFEKEMLKLVDTVKVNKYKSYDEIIKESKTIQTSDDFKKIKAFLPDNLKFTDEFGNDIKWGIKITKWFATENYYFSNTDFNFQINNLLSKLDNLNKDDLIDLNIAGLNYLYDIFEDDTQIYNFLLKNKVNSQISKDITINKKVDEIYSNSNLVGYWLYAGNKALLTYWNKFNFSPRIDLLLNKDGSYSVYLNMALKDYIYIGNNEKWEKEYLIIDAINRKFSFWKASISWITGTDIVKDTTSNINIVFDDGKSVNNKSTEFSLKDFKSIINKKISRINIDWEDISSGILIQKWSLIDLYK